MTHSFNLNTVEGRLSAMYTMQNELLRNGELTKSSQEPFNRVIRLLLRKSAEQQLANSILGSQEQQP